jgi:type IV secretion system protein VirB10
MAPADILGRELAAVQSGQYGGAGVGAGASAAGGTGRQDDQNGQGDKNTYAEQARSRKEDVSVHLSRQPEMTKYEIQAGWDIPATLEQGINSDLPGEVRGIVRENVYDSSSGHYLLIPQGSRVVGRYNSRISFGQSGIQVIWTRLIYPDGSSIELGGLNGQDARGLSGFRDRVDNHYARLIGDVLMSSALSAGVEIGANGGTTSNAATVLTPQQIATAALAQQLGEFGMEVARRDMNRQPTITIPIGYRFNIRVQKDLIFDSAYHDEAATWNR